LKESRGLTKEHLAVLYDGEGKELVEEVEMEEVPADDAVTDVEESREKKLHEKSLSNGWVGIWLFIVVL
jgi:hypothetical protein